PGGKAGYEQKAFPEAERKGKLRLVASPDGREGSVTIRQDVSLYAALPVTGETLRHELAPGRHAWVHVARGHVEIGGEQLEADDGLASGAKKFADEVDQVRIMTPDKDLGQCLRGDRVVQIDRRQRKLTDEATFRANRGFGPASVPDFLALTGDTADGIPGIDGFGEKGAALLVGAYEHIEAIPDLPHAWTVKPRGALTLAATLAAR